MQNYNFARLAILGLTILTLKTILGSQILAITGPAKCGKLLLNNTGTPPQVLSSLLGISSEFLCAGLCFFQEPSCVTFHYFKANTTCFVYGGSFKPLIGFHEQVCQKANYFQPTTATTIPSTIPSTTLPTTLATSPPTTLSTAPPTTLSTKPSTVAPTTAAPAPTWLNGCGTSPTTYVNTGTICPNLSNCTCNKGLNAVDTAIANSDACFNKCATTTNCLAFSFITGYCRIAITSAELPLVSANTGFVCYCKA